VVNPPPAGESHRSHHIYAHKDPSLTYLTAKHRRGAYPGTDHAQARIPQGVLKGDIAAQSFKLRTDDLIYVY